MFENCNYCCNQCYPDGEVQTVEGTWESYIELECRKCHINWYECKKCGRLTRLRSDNDKHSIGDIIN